MQQLSLPQGSGMPAEAAKPAPSPYEERAAYEAELLVRPLPA